MELCRSVCAQASTMNGCGRYKWVGSSIACRCFDLAESTHPSLEQTSMELVLSADVPHLQ